MRLIDAEQFEKELRAMWLDLHGRRPPLKHPVTLKKIRTLLKKQGEIECIPVAWIKLQIRDYQTLTALQGYPHDGVWGNGWDKAWEYLIERWQDGKAD